MIKDIGMWTSSNINLTLSLYYYPYLWESLNLTHFYQIA